MFHRHFLPQFSILLLSGPLAACSASSASEPPLTPTPSPLDAEPAALSTLSSEPGPSPQEIKAVIDGSEPDVRQCYIAGTFKDSQLAGTVSVTFTIETNGFVSQAMDSGSSLPDSEVVDCVVEVFTKLEFRPGGAGPTEVTYPISFGSRG